jgi:serine/threonine protein kinase
VSDHLDPRLDGAGAFSDEAPLPPLDPQLPSEVFLITAADPLPSDKPSGRPRPAEAPRRRGRTRGERRRRSDEELLARGTIIDKYVIDRVLGRGGFAVVYRATHLILGSPVAIKLVRPRVLARQPQLAALLCQEARFAARINHPNVVRVHDVTHTDRITYVVMEYIEGRSLAEAIHAEGRLPPGEVVRVGLAVAAGLRVGLVQGLIHRDIKPANILLATDGAVKIVDLGLAHAPLAGEAAEAPEAPRATDSFGNPERVPEPSRDGAQASKLACAPRVVGTYGYMSPEQAADPERVDFRSDVYALGVTLYEAATGALPFPARDAARCLELHRTQPVPPPESRVPGLPPALCALLTAMLAKRPEDRPSSYEALESSLKRIVDPPVGDPVRATRSIQP